ncbi:olfactory receptor 2AT4-like [Trichomycterus rosablanca]|uniref:olfactory receptor 2AT4-like n=1 Tax=Trichomycterus rosablanca TaxID=2290929 RepID=UPI002F351B53
MSNENVTSAKNFVIVGFPGLHPNYYGIASAVMCFIYLCTLTGNGLFFALFIREKSLQKPAYFIMLNLAVSDVLFSTTTLPKAIARYWFTDMDISFAACFVQMHFVHYFGSVNALVLGIMAFDRYVAVCHPLRYASIIKDSTTLMMCVTAWLVAEPFILIPVIRAYPLPYCNSNRILQCYCDHSSLSRIACADTSSNHVVSLTLALIVLLTPLAFIMFSYTSIITAVCRISSRGGRLKTLSTCSSQLLIIALYFLPRCFNYMSPNLGITLTPDQRVLMVMCYALLPPMINPLIYCFKMKEARESLKKSFARSTFFQFVGAKVDVFSVHK